VQLTDAGIEEVVVAARLVRSVSPSHLQRENEPVEILVFAADGELTELEV
jgi:hypothetical protein